MHSRSAQCRQKGFVRPLLIIATVLLLGSGIYFFQNNQANKPVQITPYNNYNNSKTYNNQGLGFEFEYQKTLITKEDSEQEFNKRGNGEFRKNFKSYIQYEPGKVLGAAVVLDKDGNFDTNPFTVWVFDNPDNLTVDKWYKLYWYYPLVWGDFSSRRDGVAPTQEATVSGQTGKFGVFDYKEGKPKFIYLTKDKKMYLFRIIGGSGDQILAKFKFLTTGADEKEQAGCKITGCSGQVCSDEDVTTTCEFRQEYACYKNAKCERQTNGKCGWTQTSELTKCLEETSSLQ